MKQVLVTGGAGFIGSHLVEQLLTAGHAVTVIDNFDEFYNPVIKKRNIANVQHHPHYRFIEQDIRDWETLFALPGEFDGIVHLAAKAGVRPSIEHPLEYQDVNVRGTQNMLEFAKARGIKQFVFASSSSVYGVNPHVPWTESDEGLRPISPYAATKVSGELLGHVYSHLYGIRFIGLRFFTVYGPRQRPDLAIHKFARKIMQNEPISLFGDGTTSRDYTYVADIVEGIYQALLYTASDYEIVNLGNHQTVSLQTMVKTLECHLGKRANLQYLPMQQGDVPITYADVAKAGRLFGYQPKTSFDTGIQQFVAWLQKQA